MKKIISFLKANWLIIAITIIGLILRFWRLKFPQEVVFDETYYSKFAHDYLTGQPFFDVHPPFGKILIALGELMFGYNSFGWRIIGAILGTLMLPLSYLVALRIFKNKTVAILTAALILFDGLFLVEARTGLLINSLTFFILLSYYFVLTFIENKKLIYFILGTISIGLAMSIQWLAAPFWLLLGIFLYWKKGLNWWRTLLFIFVPALVYALTIFFDRHQSDYHSYFQYIVWWHQQALGYHVKLKDTHPYASRWWTWLLMWRPVWFYSKTIDGRFFGIDGIGNPLIWWPALAIFLSSIYDLFRNRKMKFVIPIASFALYYLLWAGISRTQFQYYIMLVLPFYFMILAYYWEKLFRAHKTAGYLYLIIIAITFFAFYPILTAYPVSDHYWRSLMWFDSWI